ncbi:MAG: hypothetical protein ACTSPI_06095, partial [Candidatus Heimdallarchaeaceae archaeon]
DIWPVEYDLYGDMSGNLGNIGDGRLIVLHANLGPDIGGYFWGINEYTQAELDASGLSDYKSNEWEMIFINGVEDRSSTIAHEFQHLIHFNYDQDEVRWFDEGCAVFAEYMTDRMPSEYNGISYWSENYFKEHSDDSLIYWNYYSEEHRDVRIDYGGAYLFVFYLYEQFGYSGIRTFVQDTRPVVESINDELEPLGMTFNDLFFNWQIALLIDDYSLEGGKYGYENISFTIEPIKLTYVELDVTIKVPYYGFYTLEINYLNRFMDIRLTNIDNERLGIIVLYLKQDNTLLSYEKFETTEQTIFIEAPKGTNKVLLSLAYIDEETPSIAGDFGVGPSVDVRFKSLEHFKLLFDDPEIHIEGRNLYLADLDILFTNLTEIPMASEADSVSVLIENEENSKTFTLNYDEANFEGWGGELDLKGLKKGVYEIVLDASTGDFSVSAEISEFEYTPPIPVWLWLFGGLLVVSAIAAITLFVLKR